MFIKEPPRTVATTRPNIFASLKVLSKIATYRKGVLGYAAYTFAVGGFGYWAPTFLVDEYGQDLSPDPSARLEVANFRFGILLVIGGAIGTAVGGWLSDRWTRGLLRPLQEARGLMSKGPVPEEEVDRMFVHANLKVCALSAAIGAPLAVAAFFAPNSTVFFAISFTSIIGLFLSASPANAVVLRSVPVDQRAAAMALSIFTIHILGDLWSPPLIGALVGVVPRAYAMMLIPLAIALAAVIWVPRRLAPAVPRPG
jgi:MFS family permease